ncbi:MAG: hypothetical protein ACI837_000104 [Crocinitomicaceae bacterium]
MALSSGSSDAPNDDVSRPSNWHTSESVHNRDTDLVKLTTVNLVIVAVGTAFTFYDIFTIMIAALPVIISSSLMIRYGHKWKRILAGIIGWSGLAAIVAIPLIIELNDYSLSSSQGPLPPLILIMVTPSIFLSLILLARELGRMK